MLIYVIQVDIRWMILHKRSRLNIIFDFMKREIVTTAFFILNTTTSPYNPILLTKRNNYELLNYIFHDLTS